MFLEEYTYSFDLRLDNSFFCMTSNNERVKINLIFK